MAEENPGVIEFLVNPYGLLREVEMKLHKFFNAFGINVGPPVVVGQRYRLDGYEPNPFKRSRTIVHVADKREGWVMYQFVVDEKEDVLGNTASFSKEAAFKSIYSPDAGNGPHVGN